jgi:hypothetical protein
MPLIEQRWRHEQVHFLGRNVTDRQDRSPGDQESAVVAHEHVAPGASTTTGLPVSLSRFVWAAATAKLLRLVQIVQRSAMQSAPAAASDRGEAKHVVYCDDPWTMAKLSVLTQMWGLR